MRRRIAVVILVGGIVGLGLLPWPERANHLPPSMAVAPTDVPVDALTKGRREPSADPLPSAASAASPAPASRAGTTFVPASKPGLPVHEPVLPAAPLAGTQQSPRQPLATLGDPAPATADPPRPTGALQAVPPQPLPPVSRVPLTPSAATADAGR